MSVVLAAIQCTSHTNEAKQRMSNFTDTGTLSTITAYETNDLGSSSGMSRDDFSPCLDPLLVAFVIRLNAKTGTLHPQG
jgi:hypothetical protein